jgi:head-tail adaptor
MILRHSVIIQSRVLTKSSEGIVLSTWSTFKTIAADVQPANLNKVEAQAFGITDRMANTKKMFFRFDTTIVEKMRAVWNGKTFDVMGLNDWNEHCAALLVPVVQV